MSGCTSFRIELTNLGTLKLQVTMKSVSKQRVGKAVRLRYLLKV